jgi:PAS domain S-box-containing protein
LLKIAECIECVAHLIPIPIYWLDLNQRYLGINEAALNAIGASFSNKAFAEKTPYDIYPQEVASRIINQHKKVIESKKPLSFKESFFDNIAEEVKYFNTVITPLLDEEGTIIGTVSTSVDLTSEKKLSKLLKKEKTHVLDPYLADMAELFANCNYYPVNILPIERFITSIAEHLACRHDFEYLEIIASLIPANVYWLDKNNTILGVNDHTLQAVGVSSHNDIIGKTVYDLYPKEMADEIVQHHNEAMRINSTLKHEEVIKDVSSGRIKVFSAVKAPLHDNDGNTIGTIGISMDITKEKQAEIAKADFLSNMEHDLRTPFSGIRGIADLLYSQYANKYPELSGLLEIMIKSCIQWENIINHIFAVMDPQRDATPIKVESISISKQLLEIKEMNTATLYLKKLEFEIMPIPDEIDEIETDWFKLRLILSSLINNAINFTEQGKVKVAVYREKIDYKIQVIDTGIGIPPDKFDYIFERFTKLSRSNTHAGDFQGVGLGLYVAKEYAQQLGATILVESTLGEGSVFTIKLPIKDILAIRHI